MNYIADGIYYMANLETRYSDLIADRKSVNTEKTAQEIIDHIKDGINKLREE